MSQSSHIFSINFELPGDQAELINFRSEQSLFDCDIVIFWPELDGFNARERYQGKPAFYENAAFDLRKCLAHWKSQLEAALNEGKTVFFYLVAPEEVVVDSGRRQYSGTGRNRQDIRMVDLANSYDVLPLSVKPIAGTGRKIKTTKDLGLLANYWSLCSDCSYYEVYLRPGFVKKPPLVVGEQGNAVAAIGRHGLGRIVFLPPLDFPESFSTRVKGEDQWTSDALVFANRFAACLREIDKALKAGVDKTPRPDWITPKTYPLIEEDELAAKIVGVNIEIQEAQSKLKDFEARKDKAGILRYLLYEKGKQLEAAVLETLKLLGFRAENFKDPESEFDAVFVSQEGRFLGEVEGKDNKAVNIDKLDQLERNIREDFQREEVTEHAHGVLFGNAYRLQPIEERNDCFTAKCLTGAKRANVALVRTHDLFEVARYLKENKNAAFAEVCRKAIFSGKGNLVAFPAPPKPE